jgi:pyruvate dehydrogenase E1 component beta subunit
LILRIKFFGRLNPQKYFKKTLPIKKTLRSKATVLASLAKTNRLVVAEEGWPTCSVGSEILAICMEEGFDDLDAPVLRITNEDVPMPYAANLEKATLVNADKIVAGVRRTLGV